VKREGKQKIRSLEMTDKAVVERKLGDFHVESGMVT